jgi:hypothetical protein
MTCCHYSQGAIVNISKSLLLFEETKKINSNKKEAIESSMRYHWSAG